MLISVVARVLCVDCSLRTVRVRRVREEDGEELEIGQEAEAVLHYASEKVDELISRVGDVCVLHVAEGVITEVATFIPLKEIVKLTGRPLPAEELEEAPRRRLPWLKRVWRKRQLLTKKRTA